MDNEWQIPEYDPEKFSDAKPWQLYVEPQGGGLEPFMFNEQKRRDLENGPGLYIIAPENFELTEEKLRAALQKLSDEPTQSVRELINIGVNYSDIEPIKSERFNVDECVGSFEPCGWSGLVEGMGEPRSLRTPDVQRVLGYAKQIVALGPYAARAFVQDMYMCVYEDEQGNAKYFVDGDGRHRMMTFKALSELGYVVELENVAMNVLRKNPNSL